MTARKTTATPFDLEQDEKNSMEEMLELIEDREDFTTNSLIQATVIDSDREHVYLDIGKKQEGRCRRAEFTDAPQPGVEIPVIVLSTTDDGAIRLSKKEAERRIAWQSITEAFENAIQMSGRISRVVTHGYIVEMEGLDLFLPLSQSATRVSPKNRFQVGKTIDFKILELKEKHRSAIISHRKVIEERNDASWNELMENYAPGNEVEGTITKIVSFGVFIQVGDIEGLLHQSDISWKKYTKFKGRFKRGQTISVIILSMDRENNRLSLGLKQFSEDPWEWAQRELKIGDVITGRVTSITDYGAFIELTEGLEGLVHVSELTWAKRVKHPKKYLQIGQELEATVLALDFDSRRISLGIRQLQEDPWENLTEEFRVGEVREGEVTSVTKFGAFVKLKEDVEGLIHFNDFSWDEKVNRKMLKKGDTCTFKVLDLDIKSRRISCGIKQLTPSPYELLRKKYKNGQILECKIRNVTDFGLFAELEEGFEGLIHISNIPLRGEQKLEDAYKVGDVVTAVLQKIDVESKKIALSIKAYVRKQDQEVFDQYMKKDDSPSTSSLGSFFKEDKRKNVGTVGDDAVGAS